MRYDYELETCCNEDGDGVRQMRYDEQKTEEDSRFVRAVAPVVHGGRDPYHKGRKHIATEVVVLSSGMFRFEDFHQHKVKLNTFQTQPGESRKAEEVQETSQNGTHHLEEIQQGHHRVKRNKIWRNGNTKCHWVYIDGLDGSWLYLVLCFVDAGKEKEFSKEQTDTQVLMNGVPVSLETSQEAEGGYTDSKTHQRDHYSHPRDDGEKQLIYTTLVLGKQNILLLNKISKHLLYKRLKIKTNQEE